MEHGGQVKTVMVPGVGAAKGWELALPNPKLKLLDSKRSMVEG
jgi:hypothetical protein